jgi:hypothetical protein
VLIVQTLAACQPLVLLCYSIALWQRAEHHAWLHSVFTPVVSSTVQDSRTLMFCCIWGVKSSVVLGVLHAVGFGVVLGETAVSLVHAECACSKNPPVATALVLQGNSAACQYAANKQQQAAVRPSVVYMAMAGTTAMAMGVYTHCVSGSCVVIGRTLPCGSIECPAWLSY